MTPSGGFTALFRIRCEQRDHARRWVIGLDGNARHMLNLASPKSTVKIERSILCGPDVPRTTSPALLCTATCSRFLIGGRASRRGDSPMFIPVLDGLWIPRRGPGRPRRRPDRVRGDKAYSSRDNRAHLRPRGVKATIAQPPDDRRSKRRRRGPAGGHPTVFDKAQHGRRSAVERCATKWKQFRAVATRYDKRDYIFNGTLTITATVIWLRDTVQEPSEAP
ncbi:transposase [Streptomyces sp. SAI-133]|uniref:transposase n=1 Tax=Streptomyces sp. SAI-133 TaxID=2940547 RepID=UPI0032B012C5